MEKRLIRPVNMLPMYAEPAEREAVGLARAGEEGRGLSADWRGGVWKSGEREAGVSGEPRRGGRLIDGV